MIEILTSNVCTYVKIYHKSMNLSHIISNDQVTIYTSPLHETSYKLTHPHLPEQNRSTPLNRPAGPVKEVQPSGASILEPQHCSIVLLANIKIDIFTLEMIDVANVCPTIGT